MRRRQLLFYWQVKTNFAWRVCDRLRRLKCLIKFCLASIQQKRSERTDTSTNFRFCRRWSQHVEWLKPILWQLRHFDIGSCFDVHSIYVTVVKWGIWKSGKKNERLPGYLCRRYVAPKALHIEKNILENLRVRCEESFHRNKRPTNKFPNISSQCKKKAVKRKCSKHTECLDEISTTEFEITVSTK